MSYGEGLLMGGLYMGCLILFCVPFVRILPRRKWFCVRLLPVFLLCTCLVIFGQKIWPDQVVGNIVENSVDYLFLFFSVLFLFRCTPWISLYGVTASYALQRVNMHLLAPLLRIVLGTGDRIVLFTILEGVSAALEFFLAEWIFTRRLQKDDYSHMSSRWNVLISVLLMASVISFNSIDQQYSSQTPGLVNIEISLFSFSLSLLTLILLYEIFRLDRSEKENAVIRNLWERDKKQLEISRETVDRINVKCHDLRHFLSAMQNQTEGNLRAELERLRGILRIYDTRIETGNDILNLILMEKSLLCQQENITVKCMADGICLGFMEEADIYSLFGNLMDNAISAVKKIKAARERVIQVFVREVSGMLSIIVENPYVGTIQYQNSLPITENPDKNIHGYGVRSIRMITEKYNGEMSISDQDHIFTVSILLPLNG